MSIDRLRCRECGWVGDVDDALAAPNPFATDEIMLGCPNCHQAECLYTACYRSKCKREASIGKPTKAGYVWSCGEHEPPGLDEPERPA